MIDINSPAYLQFVETMQREGQLVDIDGKSIKAFFRTDKSIAGSKTKEPYITAFTAYSDNIKPGALFSVANDKYIAIKDNSNENEIYNKTYAVKCNQVISYMLRKAADNSKADITTFYVNADDISQRESITSSVSTLTSSGHFIFPLNDLTRRLLVNDRFYAGNTIPWVIRDIVLQNDLCEVYTERSQVDTPNDDLANLVADRWKFEHKPDTYTVSAEPASVTLTEGNTAALTVSVMKNGTAMSPTPVVAWTADNGNATITTDNVITGVTAGSTALTGAYKEQDNDICLSANVAVTIEAKPVQADIVVNPAYDNEGYYAVLNGSTQTFTATIEGIASPIWTITLNPNGNASTAYTSVITGNIFKVTAKTVSNKYLIYTVSESVSGKTANYNVKLASLF